jgi:hypothetical protein
MMNLNDIIYNIINSIIHYNPETLIYTMRNLEFLQHMVGVPQNGYDIDINNLNLFFELLFQSQNLSVELVNGVYLNVLNVNNVNYTVHPDYIEYILNQYIILEPIFEQQLDNLILTITNK